MLHHVYFGTSRISDSSVVDGEKNTNIKANKNNAYALPSLRTSMIQARNICGRFQNDYSLMVTSYNGAIVTALVECKCIFQVL
jgi:hypothetical protein